MLGLPHSTELIRRITKQTVCENEKISATLKKKFIDQIESITWRNKLAVETINVSKGAYVDEIEIIELKLRADHVDDKVLRLIDNAIPYRIIFVLSRNGRYQLCAAYKEGSTVGQYFKTDWVDEDQLTLTLQGLTLDELYENFIRQIIGKDIAGKYEKMLKDILIQHVQIQKLETEIKTLKRKVRAEKQFNRQIEMNGRLKNLQAELERLRNGSGGG